MQDFKHQSTLSFLQTGLSILEVLSVIMAASAVAGVADPHTPLPPNAPPPSSVGLRSSAKQRLPHLEPPTAKSEGEHLQNKLALPPTRSERGSDFLPPELLQTLKEQQRRRASVGAEPALREGNQPPPPPSISKRAQSPKKDGEVCYTSLSPTLQYHLYDTSSSPVYSASCAATG